VPGSREKGVGSSATGVGDGCICSIPTLRPPIESSVFTFPCERAKLQQEDSSQVLQKWETRSGPDHKRHVLLIARNEKHIWVRQSPMAQPTNDIRPAAGDEREFGASDTSPRPSPPECRCSKVQEISPTFPKTSVLGDSHSYHHRASRHQRKIESADAPEVTAMISGVREIASSVTICSPPVVRHNGGKGGDGFCPALRMNPRIAFTSSLGVPQHV